MADDSDHVWTSRSTARQIQELGNVEKVVITMIFITVESKTDRFLK